MISISHIPCYYGNSVVLAARVKPGSQSETWQQATPWIAVCLKDLYTKYDSRRASNGKVTSIYLCCYGYNILILTS